MSYDPMTRKAPVVVACIICHTLTHCSVAWSPKLVVLAVKSAVRPTYCYSDARYPGMEVTRPAAQQEKMSKVRPPSSLFNHFRLTGPYSQSLYRATPPRRVVEKCVPVGSQSWRLECNLVDCLPQIEAVLMGLGSCEWLDDP